MSALAEWLKQIIMVVLLAAFIDMLLPNRSMQRYVKLVVSLFILLTMLTPVMNWIGAGVNLRLLAAAVEGLESGAFRPETENAGSSIQGGTFPPLKEVLSRGEALAQERNERSLALLAEELAVMVEEHVRTQHGVEAKAAAELEMGPKGWPEIRALRIQVGASLAKNREAKAGPEAEDAGGQGKETGPLRVEPMKPIEVKPVSVEPVRIGEEPIKEEASASLPAPVAEKERRRIAESVAKAWDIPAERVIVE